MAEISGWYYDNQLKNPLTSVSLHPNMVPVYIKDTHILTGWEMASSRDGLECDKDVFCCPENNGCGYTTNYTIATSILTEDFNIAITNSYSPLGEDAISGLWNQLKPVAPYLPEIQGALASMAGTTSDFAEKSDSKIIDWLSIALNKVSNNRIWDFTKSHINDVLIMQGTRFSYYSGSNVGFGNLNMRYTIFPKFDGKNFITVNEQLTELFPYVNGYIEELSGDDLFGKDKDATTTSITKIQKRMKEMAKSSLEEGKELAKETSDKIFGENSDKLKNKLGNFIDNVKTNTLVKGVVKGYGELKELMDSIVIGSSSIIDDMISTKKLFSWQKAPGGFEPYYYDMDAPQKGTLKLRIGTQYSINSLVCSDINFQCSKQSVKNPIDNSLSPLYCDVSLTLQPVTRYSNESLSKFVDGKNNSKNGLIKLENNLKDIESEIKKLYLGNSPTTSGTTL